MEFSIETAALSAASCMWLIAIAFYYLSSVVPHTPALKWWGVSFSAITIDYIMVFFLPLDKFGLLIPLWEAVHVTFVLGLLIGVLFFLDRKISLILIGTFWSIIVGWGILSAMVDFSFFFQTIPATIITSGIIFYSGWILFKYKPIYQESGYRFAGLAFFLWGLNRLTFSFLELIPWFTPFGYVIAQLTAMAMGIGLIISVLERQHHRAIISEIKVTKTTQKAKIELEQRVTERTIELQQEIHDRKKTENALKRSEAQFKKMIEKSPLPMVITDSNNDISYFNNKFIALFGYTLEDISTAEQWWEMAYPDAEYRAKVSHSWIIAIEKADANKTDIEMQEWNITIKDGTKRTCEFYMVPLKASSLIVMKDITEHKQLETQLQRSRKIESIGTLAGGIAHDFNNILFPIIGYAEMLIADVSANSPFQKSLKAIYTSALRARDLVQQILTFSRHESGELKLIKMQPIVKEVLKLIRSTIPTTIKIEQSIQKKCGMIKADPLHIYQIVMNLATNAYHAMEATGGVLKVSLKEIKLGENELSSPDLTSGNYACLTIADTGIGMDKILIEKIFDPFFTTKELGQGTGMGLSIVYGIITGMQGSIKILSEPDKGTEILVYLPIAESVKEQIAVFTEEFISGGTEHILLVDDELPIVQMEKEMLERLGYKVTSHVSSMDALETFCADPNMFDLVITDMAMPPNMSGETLSIELTKIRSDIPILICTGFSEAMSQEKSALLGIKGFLLKPIEMHALSQKIRDVLDTYKV